MSNLDFIVAKVRGMRGQIHEGPRLLSLCDVPNIRDLAAVLAPDQPIGDTIGLQRHLTEQHIASLHGLLKVLDGWEAGVFLAMLRRYQAENLKVILRCWAAKADETLLAAYTVDVPGALALPTPDLLKSPDLETLISRIPVSSLRDGAMQGLGEHEESGRLFFVEAGIDKACFAQLNDAAERAHGAARDAVLQLVRLELDIYNVMLVLRGVFNYSLNFNKLRLLMAPFGKHAGIGTLEAIRAASDIVNAVPLVPSGLLGRDEEPQTADDVEAAMWRNMYHTAHRRYYTSVLDFGAVAAFYYIKRIELRNLITISEHLRYGESGAAVCDKLIGLPQAAAAEAL